MKLTDSKRRIYDQGDIDINVVQDMLRDDEHLYVDVDTGGYIFFGTPRRLNNIIDNPINGPIASAKRKQERLDEAQAYLRIKGAGGVLGDEEIAAVVRTVVDEWTTMDAAEYYGITGCADVWEENLRWLTERGTMNSDGTYGKGKQTPVLVWADGSTIDITMADARHKLEFKTQILFRDFLYFNAARVEAGLQREYKEG